MNTESKIFLRKRFKEYYYRNEVSAPSEVEKREFGVGTLESKIKVRHKGFQTEKDLQNYLRREGPFYISYSSAYFEFPENQPMSAKNWLGADLVFDLDLDMDFLDSGKLEGVKKEAMNLIDFLVSDFGFQRGDLEVNFSGGKGYHVKVFDECIRTLGGDERREIVDYVTGTGLDLGCFMEVESVEGFTPGKSGRYTRSAEMLRGPQEGDPGWAGRIYDVAMKFVSSDVSGLQEIEGIGPKKAEEIANKRESNVRSLRRGRWEGLSELVVGMQHKVIEKNAVGLMGDTDKMVTIDTSRLIRLPDTLHGGSGLIAKRIKDLDSFSPLTDAVAFGDEEIKLEVKEKIPAFDLMGRRFKYSPGTAKVPEQVAVYLMLKDKAEILSD
ncbi:MAG: DNA primase small subunit PriS [Candidatus Altiarchaeota archaeon]|nr:DNA primase small subunit PriS [Candidatus Altiarchaeota archaeon]